MSKSADAVIISAEKGQELGEILSGMDAFVSNKFDLKISKRRSCVRKSS